MNVRLVLCALLAASAAHAQTFSTNTNAGDYSLPINQGKYDSAFGAQSLRNNTNGWYNTASGANALFNNDIGSYNTAIGAGALYLSKGNFNVAVGNDAGSVPTAGDHNIWIAHNGQAKDNAVIRIGTQGVQKFAQIAGIYGVKLPAAAGGGQALYVNKNGQIGVLSTVLHTKVEPQVTREEFLALQSYATAVANQVHALQRENAALSKQVALLQRAH